MLSQATLQASSLQVIEPAPGVFINAFLQPGESVEGEYVLTHGGTPSYAPGHEPDAA